MRLLLIATPQDKPYLQRLKACIGTASCSVIFDTPSTFTELNAVCKAKNADAIISTSPTLLDKLLSARANQRKKPSIDNYAGSLFQIPSSGMECVFINPLEQLITVPYGEFITRRYISKLTEPSSWMKTAPFHWKLFEPDMLESILKVWAGADAIAIDIETFSTPPAIRCVGYTALFIDSKRTDSIVIPCDSLYNLACIRKLNNLEVPKIFQNGKYDLSYLQAYNAAPWGYFWDTAEMYHSWYSELPKDLASLNSFFVRESMYWKDLADTTDLMQYYLYNAKDTWATANVFLAWMAESPEWAKNNYANTFPLQFPCHLSEMTGIARDLTVMDDARLVIDAKINSMSASLDKMLNTTGFNVNSPKQIKQMLKVLGCGDLESGDKENLSKAALRHPINTRIIRKIIGLPASREVEDLGIRSLRKLKSTYLRVDADATKQNPTGRKEFNYHESITGKSDGRKPRILYSLNPHGTDTGRLASKEHHFWCGLQIQNIPRGTFVKRTLIADNGFRIAECDLEQAESRDTAFISGDTNLINAVSSSRDFHSVNASAFFGVHYDSIYDDSTGKTRDKKLRDLAKRVNHGANYNMGPGVLVETMGEDKIIEAKRLLKLPKLWGLKQVAEYLLAQFHKTYPAISRTYYTGVIHEITTTKMLTSKAIHEVDYQANSQGLVRYCFSDPSKSKSALNAYVAHPPQSLNAMTLNRAYMKVFYEIAIPNPNDFKLIAQIHDSILFQFRIGCEHLIQRVKDCMEIPVTITGYDGKCRTFTVPAAAKAGSDGKGATNWGETE